MRLKNWIGLSVVFAAAVTSAQNSGKLPPADTSAQSHVAIAHELPALDGSHLNASIVEVTYGPGGYSLPHSHPCPVIGYVIEGALRIKLNRDPEVVYHAGQSFYEAPNSAHLVSANASDKKPVKFLAYFVCDHTGPRTVAMPEPTTSGDKR